MILKEIIGLFIPLYIYHKIKNRTFLNKNDFKFSFKDVIDFTITGISVQIAGTFINSFTAYIYYKFSFDFPVSEELPKTPAGILLFIVAFCIVPAICEEIFFRKYMYERIALKYKKISLIIPALIFASFHFNMLIFLSTFFMGIYFSVLLKKGRKLSFTIGCHFISNLSSLIFQSSFLPTGTLEIVNKYFLLFSILAFFILYRQLKSEKN